MDNEKFLSENSFDDLIGIDTTGFHPTYKINIDFDDYKILKKRTIKIE
jgi:hypothetical protein